MDWDYDRTYGSATRDYDRDYWSGRGGSAWDYDRGSWRDQERYGRDYDRGYGREGYGRMGNRYGGYGGYGQGYGQGYGGYGQGYGGYGGGQRGMFGAPTWTYVEYWLIPGPQTGRGPRGYQRSDERIKEDVCDRLTQHGQLDASGIQVQVNNREVTLTGTVGSRQEKRMAEDCAESVAGVEDVHNQIRVEQQSQQQGQSGQQAAQSGQQQEQTARSGQQSQGRARTASG